MAPPTKGGLWPQRRQDANVGGKSCGLFALLLTSSFPPDLIFPGTGPGRGDSSILRLPAKVL